MILFSLVKNLVETEGEVSINELVRLVREGTVYEHIKKLRELIALGNKEDASTLKKKLPAFIPSGVFKEYRKKENLHSYSQIVVLDFDHVEDVTEALVYLQSIPFTLFSFKSPSGQGIKVLVKTNGEKESHENSFRQVAIHYEKATALSVDPSGKDIARLCFLSHDPDAYYNPNAETFCFDNLPSTGEGERYEVNSGEEPSAFETLIDACAAYLDQREQYQVGNRNNYIFKLACLCNKFGIEQREVERYIPTQFDLDEGETFKAIESAYINADEFDSMPSFFKLSVLDGQFSLRATPFLRDEVYQDLPQILKRATEVITNSRERDMLFLSSLGVFSGCLINFWGNYDGKTVYPNLYVFIIAPPASGKGILVQSKALGQEYHNRLVEEGRKAMAEYEEQLMEYRANKGIDGIEKMDLPIEPKQMIFYIPGNSSSAAFIERMVQSQERVMLFETEADTISSSLKQDWGSYSEIMRGGFHHEWVGINRKGKGGLNELHQPRLSIAISGTPSQLQGLVRSIEDGLFSRFMYYIFEEAVHWKDVSPGKKVANRDDFFKALSLKVMDIIKFHEENRTEFHFSSSQWDRHNDYFDMLTSFYRIIYGEDAYRQSVINRMGLIRYRIAMILSALRQYDTEDVKPNYLCSELDFGLSEKIVETVLHHAFVVMSRLPKKSDAVKNPLLNKLFKVLPQSFSRAEAVEKASTLKIKPRTADSYLKLLVDEGKLSKEGNGTYQKV
ncbi:DUF3987 domain-containing protein [Flaviaesturariibacter aridisoli]|uniref:DUF3987 domain-containing protein n=1 Tax=Flaviaesturariibacter aridisoli TaxID=2545761 RepID=A0A4R4E349_9BACT|nr:DUF3987 domain-containing protein [Flaviaesturariibacter aridisoli]TCZ73829.1 DUF3987 domain-containing protein [Flaviaesturariibacter aridisoli]